MFKETRGIKAKELAREFGVNPRKISRHLVNARNSYAERLGIEIINERGSMGADRWYVKRGREVDLDKIFGPKPSGLEIVQSK